MALKDIINDTVSIRHPDLPGINGIAYVMFRHRESGLVTRTCTTLKPGRMDRSPCGTGSSANLAAMHARGGIEPGDRCISRSITGSEFQVEMLGRTEVAGRPAVLPRISGRAWVFGMHQIGHDPTDPFGQGFAFSDCWGPDVAELR